MSISTEPKTLSSQIKLNNWFLDEKTLWLRESVYRFVARLGLNEQFDNYATNLYENRSNQSIPFHIQMPVLTSILRRAEDSSVIDELMEMYSRNDKDEDDDEEQEQIKEILGETINKDAIKRVLKESLKVI